MDSLIETIAAWPAWVWLIGTILWALGAVLHMDRFATIYLTSNGARVQCTWWHVAWLLFWPIVTPLALPYLAIRRLRRWSRARRVEPPVYKRIALIRRMETLRDAARGVVKVPQCWKVSADMAVVLGYDPEHIEHDGMEHYLLGRPVLRCDDYWTRLDYVAIAPMPATKDQPRPTEKSAPYVLDTSREIRELRERVEADHHAGIERDEWLESIEARLRNVEAQKARKPLAAYKDAFLDSTEMIRKALGHSENPSWRVFQSITGGDCLVFQNGLMVGVQSGSTGAWFESKRIPLASMRLDHHIKLYGEDASGVVADFHEGG